MPDVSLLQPLCDVLGISLNELFSGEHISAEEYKGKAEENISKLFKEKQIAFIHEANTESKKKELFAKVRSGQVRVLLSATQKMGAGTSVQDFLCRRM